MRTTKFAPVLSLSACVGALCFGFGCSDQSPGPAASSPGGAQSAAGQSNAGSTPGGQASGGASGSLGSAAGTSGTGVGGSGSGGVATAGAGGATTAGTGGQSGGGGQGAGGNAASGKSAGCGRLEPLNEPPRKYVKHDMVVEVAPAYQPAFTTREYHTWLPDNYDPERAYPLYFWGNGCGVSQGNPQGIPVANIEEVKSGAILVFMIQEDGCFDAGKGGLADTPDVPYFEKMLNELEANYCIDQGKVFVGGYSSTAWFAATLSCSHGNRLNAVGMAAGGQQDVLPTCTGPAGVIVWAGQGDGGNPIDAPANEAWKGSGAVRDRLIAENGCSATTTKWDAKWPDCNLYDNCGKNPVVFCAHPGGHDAGGVINGDGFWKFFKSTW